MKKRRFTGARVQAVSIGMPSATVLVWGVAMATGIQVPAEVAAAFGALCTYLARVLIPDEVED